MNGNLLGLLTAIAAGLPSVAAFFAARGSRRSADDVRKQLVTGNNKTVGEMVTEVHGKESLQDTDFDTHVEGEG